MSRVIIQERKHEELVERAVKVSKSVSVGQDIERTEFGENMGSMVSEGQCDRALGTITRAGQVFVNERYAGGVETPFGGYGKSGFAPEKGGEAHWSCKQAENIAIKLNG